MATWKPENVLLTLKGNEALSKVLAGQGKLTVTRIVTGAGYVPPSTLYNQKNVSDIKQTLEISRVVTNANGSEISTTLSNINLDTAYSLYQIGVYCRHTDSDEEFLYLIAQCETDKPDTIPAKTDTIANFSYNLYIQHEGTTQFEVTVNQSGVLDVSMLGKPNGVAGLDSEGLIPKEVIPNASKIYLSDGVTSVEEAIVNGGAFIATYGTTTSAEIEAAYQKGKAVFCSYSNKLIPLVVRVSATNHQFYTGSLYCDALGNTKGLFLLCNNSVWSNDTEVVPYRHSSMHSIDGSDPVVSYMIGAKSRDNLLVNSDWSNSENIIDQRGGYVVPPNTPYFSDPQGTIQVGTTTTYVTTKVTGPGWVISVSGSEYYVAYANVVRGYTGAGYGIDRWKAIYGGETVLVKNDSVLFILSGNQGVKQIVDYAKMFAGKTVTMSVLWSLSGNYANIYCSGNNSTIGVISKTQAFDKTLNCTTFTVPSDCTDLFVSIHGDGEISAYAVKLELGSQQTLAHQENGNWVLNDPPSDKEMEALKCRISTADPSDPCANKVLVDTGDISNPNLLDNWYFARPVDQRGGYVVPPGKPYMEESTQVGTTDKYYTATPFSTWYNITVNGVVYNVAASNVVRGYVGPGYGIDRWVLNGNNTMSITDYGVKFGYVNNNYVADQPLEYIADGVYTLSVLFGDNTMKYATYEVTNGAGTGETQAYRGWIVKVGANMACIIHIGNDAPEITIKAVKLELGSHQTLAHKDKNGNWVLNDPPPDKNLEALKCRISTADSGDPFSNGSAAKMLYTGTLTTNWTAADTGYTQTLTVNGILASDTPVIGIVQTNTVATNQTLLENWALVSRITTAANSITAYAYGDAPTVALPIQILCVR